MGQDVAVTVASREQVIASTTELLVRMLRLDQPVTEDTRLMDELGLSSSQAMELLLELEDELSVAIDVDELDQEHMYTLGELASYVSRHCAPL